MTHLIICFFIFNEIWLLKIFQQGYYEPKWFAYYCIKNIGWLKYPLPFFLLYDCSPSLIHGFLAILCLLLQGFFFYKRTKKPLVWTKRIIRLFLLCNVFVVILAFTNLTSVCFLGIEVVILFCNFLLRPMDKLISQKYLKRAKNALKNFSGVCIAITGSYGKTSVKNYLGDVLSQTYLVYRSPKSYNTPLGLAKFINSYDVSIADYLIMEFGARRLGDIKELALLFPYQVAIVTALGPMHLDTFRTQENVVLEKMQLLELAPKDTLVILNYENEFIRNYSYGGEVVSYGFRYGDYQAKNLVLTPFFSQFDLEINGVASGHFNICVLGRTAVLNCLPAMIMLHKLGLDLHLIENVKPVENRLQLKKIGSYYLLNDAYNSNVEGMLAALEVVKGHQGKRYLITPGLVEVNSVMEDLTTKIAFSVNASLDCCILVENSFTKMLRGKLAPTLEVHLVKSFQNGWQLFLDTHLDNAIILIENDLPDIYQGGRK